MFNTTNVLEMFILKMTLSVLPIAGASILEL